MTEGIQKESIALDDVTTGLVDAIMAFGGYHRGDGAPDCAAAAAPVWRGEIAAAHVALTAVANAGSRKLIEIKDNNIIM